MTIQTHTVLQKLCLGIKITTRQGNYVTLLRCYVWMFVRRSQALRRSTRSEAK